MLRILYVQYTNPAAYPPLEHSSRILADSGFEVLFLGTGALGASELELPQHKRITVKRIPFSTAGWRQKLHYLKFSLWVTWWTLRWRPQWVYASDYLSCPVALLLSYWSRLRLVYHEHDSPAPSGGSLFHRLCLSARHRLSHRAEINVLPNERRAELFAREMGGIKNVVCVWNCPTVEEVGPPREDFGRGDLWVLYHGSIVPSRLPLSMIEALALLPPNVKLRVIGYETVGHRGYTEDLKGAARRYGVEDRLQLLGMIPSRRELLKWCRQSDVGLAFMPKHSNDLNEQMMVGASNKPFDYLCSGLVLLVSDLADWRAMFVDDGYGLSCDMQSSESIATKIKWFLEHPKDLRRMSEQGRERILTEWNYNRLFADVFEYLNANRLCL